jgi:PKD repeat protein
MRVVNATAAGIAATVVACLALAVPGVAFATQAQQSTVVSAVPATYTPDVNDGEVDAIAQSGPDVVLGGTFDSVSAHGSSASTSVSNLTAFVAGTGTLVSTFKAVTNGKVETAIAGPVSGTVYVGGDFTSIDGVTSSLALISTTTGAIVSGWTSPATNGSVQSLVLRGSQLFVAGAFTTVAGVSHGGLAVLNPATGALTAFATPAFTGHHNYLVNCNPATLPPPPPGHPPYTCANSSPGLKSIDVNPAATRLIAVGNFTSVSGAARDQVALLDLSATGATVDPSWKTLAYTAGCTAIAFDTYMRAVQFSADGSYFVIVTTGRGAMTLNSDGTPNNCDSAARFNTSDTGTNVAPTWIDYSGSDTFHSIAITGTAVYVGGHQRWMNDSLGNDHALEGSVPRPGIAALDPINGLPLAWNPGRNPRGQGTFALLATSDGLYVGSDTDYIGNRQYLHRKIAFFPLAGGETLASNSTNALPGSVYLLGDTGGGAGASSVNWDGSSAPGTPTAVSGIDWSTSRGAFQVNNQVYYGSTDGNFYQRSFDGTTFGPAVSIDPYDDPTWDNVQTGSGNTYQGAKSSFYSEMSSLTSMFYSNGRVYYTLSGNTHMFWRWFEPDDGVMGADEFTTTDGIDWSHVAGAFLSGSTLYFADSATKSLFKVAFNATQASGTPTLADSSIDWTSTGAFLGPGTTPVNQPPQAAFTASCTGLTCSFNAAGSNQPGGSITSYAWSFGDGTTDTTVTAADTHTYTGSGTDTVTLTVTGSLGGQATTTQTVTPTAGTTSSPVTFQGVNTSDGAGATADVTVPAGTQAGDDLLLFETYVSTSATANTPAGWTLVATRSQTGLTDAVYQRTAAAADAGSTVAVTFPASIKSSLTLADYSSAASGIEMEAVAVDKSATSHTTPTLNGLSAGSLAVSFWSDKSTTTSAWTAPASVTRRSAVFGSGGGAVSALLADSGSPVTGTYGGLTATANVSSGTGIAWTIALAST